MTKYIFDFDDVLFFNTEKFKKHMYKCFDEIEVQYDTVKKYYKIEKEKDCYIVTHGVNEYQLEKIKRTGLGPLFTQIFIVQDTKKGPVETICEHFKNNEIVFIDDKEKRFADLDFKKYPNLRTVLYVGPESIREIFE